MTIECINSTETIFSFKKLENSDLIAYAKDMLPEQGVLKQDNTKSYCYLKVDDNFIFELFPLIQEKTPKLALPDYFPPKSDSGAHVSVIYPEEMPLEKINIDEIEQVFSFELIDFFSLSAFNKTFFALTVYSPTLEQLRIKYGLPTKLNYRGLMVPFHITIAKK